MPTRLISILTVLSAGALIGGCGAGDVIDHQKAEIAVRYDVEEATGADVSKVDCPDGIAVRIGNRFACRVTTRSGDMALVELEVTSEKGDLRALKIKAP